MDYKLIFAIISTIIGTPSFAAAQYKNQISVVLTKQLYVL